MKLIVVPTPIGNLEDISSRALHVLTQADFILCEDSRHTGKLLSHFDIQQSLYSYHAHNEHKILTSVLAKIQESTMVALVSDAGMPAISDPGYLLIRACIQHEILVEVLPGPSASITALVASGIPCDRYYYQGFLPQKKGRQTRIQWLAQLQETIVLFVSPHRILKTLPQLIEHFGADRSACLARELTKLHEEYLRGTLSEILSELSNRPSIKGEMVLIIAGE